MSEKKTKAIEKDIYEEVLNMEVTEMAPKFLRDVISQQEIDRIVDMVAQELKVPNPVALMGIFLLFLKGAANSGAPLNLSIELVNGVIIQKKTLLSAYKYVMDNEYLRRLAETLATKIGKFAEKQNLRGELANSIDIILRAENGENLTPKEAAWCSSFSQSIPNLAELSSERLTKLLAEDYNRRFSKKVNKNLNEKSQKEKNKKKKK